MQPAPVDVDLTLSPRHHPGGTGTLKLEDYACVVHVCNRRGAETIYQQDANHFSARPHLHSQVWGGD